MPPILLQFNRFLFRQRYRGFQLLARTCSRVIEIESSSVPLRLCPWNERQNTELPKSRCSSHKSYRHEVVSSSSPTPQAASTDHLEDPLHLFHTTRFASPSPSSSFLPSMHTPSRFSIFDQCGQFVILGLCSRFLRCILARLNLPRLRSREFALRRTIPKLDVWMSRARNVFGTKAVVPPALRDVFCFLFCPRFIGSWKRRKGNDSSVC